MDFAWLSIWTLPKRDFVPEAYDKAFMNIIAPNDKIALKNSLTVK